jgi:hypothetical protein
MLFRLAVLGGILSFGATAVLADEAADRAKLPGKWQPTAAEKNDYGTWTLEENNRSIRITRESNGQKVAQYECNTMGRECDIKEDGHGSKVSMWFNGPRLVQMQTRGSEVVKWRFHVVGDGDTLELEVIPIAPGGKSEVIHMSRLRREADRKTK